MGCCFNIDLAPILDKESRSPDRIVLSREHFLCSQQDESVPQQSPELSERRPITRSITLTYPDKTCNGLQEIGQDGSEWAYATLVSVAIEGKSS